MITPRTNRQVATALLAVVLYACAPVDSRPSPTEPEPTATVKNTVRLVFDKPLYGKEALRAIIDSRREEIHDLENDRDLRDRTRNPDSVIAFLRTEIGTLEDQLAIPEMTSSRADSLRAFFRSKANELTSSGRSANEDQRTLDHHSSAQDGRLDTWPAVDPLLTAKAHA